MHKLIPLFFLALLVCGSPRAQAAPWEPAAGLTQVPIWPDASIPNAKPAAKPEGSENDTDSLVAGKPWVSVTDVSRPTMTVYPAKGKNTGAAVVVFPGGGYEILAIDLEGSEVCEWLASQGITGVLLKYRVPGSGPGWDETLHRHHEPAVETATQDAQRTLRLVRAHAAEWQIDPHKVGVLGFSAGGHLVAAVSTRFDQTRYPAVDAADKESCRPDFAVALYPGHMMENTTKPFELNPKLPVSKDTPPTFLVQAENDPVDPIMDSLTYYIALKNAKVPVEMHLYAEGGHAFGLRPTKFPITGWPQLMGVWLRTIGMIAD